MEGRKEIRRRFALIEKRNLIKMQAKKRITRMKFERALDEIHES